MNVSQPVLEAARTLRKRSALVLSATSEAKEWASLDRDTAICGLLVADALLSVADPEHCRHCGDEMKHDDDGPILCRHCSQGIYGGETTAIEGC